MITHASIPLYCFYRRAAAAARQGKPAVGTAVTIKPSYLLYIRDVLLSYINNLDKIHSCLTGKFGHKLPNSSGIFPTATLPLS